MTSILTVTGDGISVEREVPDETAPRLIETTMDDQNGESETVTISLTGEGIEYEREVSVNRTPEVLQVALQDDTARRVKTSETDEYAEGGLPDDFFRSLTDKQEALIQVLLEEDSWTLTEDIIEKMEDRYGYSVNGGRGIAGILSGISRRYTTEFRRDLINGNWAGEQAEFYLNEDYEEELRAGLE